MSCYKSKPAWKATYPNENGKHPIRFNQPGDKRTPDYFIDCGKCEGCRARQRMDWAIRMSHEAAEHKHNSFLTLTYDDDNLPEDGKIHRKHVKNFLERLEYKLGYKPRYYVCGEYGELTRRPHYHAIIFGDDFRESRYTYAINDKLYGNKDLERVWRNGAISIADFSHATALYTAGYVTKKISDTDNFSMQSRNPPLGKTWVRKHHDNIRRLERITIEGQEYPIPKVYMKWLEGVESFDHIKENLSQKVKTLNDQKLRAKRDHYMAKQNLRNHTI